MYLIEVKIKEAEVKKLKRKKIEELIYENSKKLTPDVTDVDVMPGIYSLCNEFRTKENNIEWRKKTLFILLLLYAPNTLLLGDKLPNRIRKRLADMYKCNPPTISQNISQIMLQYTQYSDFRDTVNHLCSVVYAKINENS